MEMKTGNTLNKKIKPTPMDNFEKLSEEEKGEIIWDLNNWIKEEQKRINWKEHNEYIQEKYIRRKIKIY